MSDGFYLFAFPAVVWLYGFFFGTDYPQHMLRWLKGKR